jgi:hypothetical protein
MNSHQYVPHSTMSRTVLWMRNVHDRRLSAVDIKPREK